MSKVSECLFLGQQDQTFGGEDEHFAQREWAFDADHLNVDKSANDGMCTLKVFMFAVVCLSKVVV